MFNFREVSPIQSHFGLFWWYHPLGTPPFARETWRRVLAPKSTLDHIPKTGEDRGSNRKKTPPLKDSKHRLIPGKTGGFWDVIRYFYFHFFGGDVFTYRFIIRNWDERFLSQKW